MSAWIAVVESVATARAAPIAHQSQNLRASPKAKRSDHGIRRSDHGLLFLRDDAGDDWPLAFAGVLEDIFF